MTSTKEVEEEINYLTKEAEKIISKLQEECWEDNRDEILRGLAKHDFGSEKRSDKKKISHKLKTDYQKWFSSSSAIIEKNYNSDRTKEFKSIYKSRINKVLKKSHISKKEMYDLIDGINNQISILNSLPDYIENQIYDIEVTISANLMDDEIEKAEFLLNNGFIRASGAIAGVVLERHLKLKCDNAEPPINYPKKASINKLNNKLKDNNIISTSKWKKIQYFSDIRNKCDHDKENDPTKQEAQDLIEGVEKIIHEVD